jgi:hypothetical protein
VHDDQYRALLNVGSSSVCLFMYLRMKSPLERPQPAIGRARHHHSTCTGAYQTKDQCRKRQWCVFASLSNQRLECLLQIVGTLNTHIDGPDNSSLRAESEDVAIDGVADSSTEDSRPSTSLNYKRPTEPEDEKARFRSLYAPQPARAVKIPLATQSSLDPRHVIIFGEIGVDDDDTEVGPTTPGLAGLADQIEIAEAKLDSSSSIKPQTTSQASIKAGAGNTTPSSATSSPGLSSPLQVAATLIPPKATVLDYEKTSGERPYSYTGGLSTADFQKLQMGTFNKEPDPSASRGATLITASPTNQWPSFNSDDAPPDPSLSSSTSGRPGSSHSQLSPGFSLQQDAESEFSIQQQSFHLPQPLPAGAPRINRSPGLGSFPRGRAHGVGAPFSSQWSFPLAIQGGMPMQSLALTLPQASRSNTQMMAPAAPAVLMPMHTRQQYAATYYAQIQQAARAQAQAQVQAQSCGQPLSMYDMMSAGAVDPPLARLQQQHGAGPNFWQGHGQNSNDLTVNVMPDARTLALMQSMQGGFNGLVMYPPQLGALGYQAPPPSAGALGMYAGGGMGAGATGVPMYAQELYVQADQFAHGEDELRHVQRYPEYKTELCRVW